jgi:hypothetical protein
MSAVSAVGFAATNRPSSEAIAAGSWKTWPTPPRPRCYGGYASRRLRGPKRTREPSTTGFVLVVVVRNSSGLQQPPVLSRETARAGVRETARARAPPPTRPQPRTDLAATTCRRPASPCTLY